MLGVLACCMKLAKLEKTIMQHPQNVAWKMFVPFPNLNSTAKPYSQYYRMTNIVDFHSGYDRNVTKNSFFVRTTLTQTIALYYTNYRYSWVQTIYYEGGGQTPRNMLGPIIVAFKCRALKMRIDILIHWFPVSSWDITYHVCANVPSRAFFFCHGQSRLPPYLCLRFFRRPEIITRMRL